MTSRDRVRTTVETRCTVEVHAPYLSVIDFANMYFVTKPKNSHLCQKIFTCMLMASKSSPKFSRLLKKQSRMIRQCPKSVIEDVELTGSFERDGPSTRC